MTIIKCVVPISGGKDSQACLQLALQDFDKSEIIGLFMDTKFEHPETYKHVEKMREMYGVVIISISAGSVDEKVRKYQRFPSFQSRHCTDELKIRPSRIFYKALAEKQGRGFLVYYGMRSDESAERAKRYNLKLSDEIYAPHEVMTKYPKYLAKMGVMFRMPVLDWTTEEIMEFLNGRHNDLYNQGFDRVGCFPCLAGGDAWKNKAFTHDKFGEQQRIRVRVLEQEIGKSVFTSKGGLAKDQCSSSGCGFCDI